MIKFFRNLRKKQLDEGKTTKYARYAIGEIVLVVIGILIALQVNNWNENRKNLAIRKNYSMSLISDFEKDSLDLSNLIIQLKKDSITFASIQKRIETSTANPDTIAQIFRYDFPVLVRIDYSFNNTTLVNLVGNNSVSYPTEIRKSMAELVKNQNDFINANSAMIDKYFDILNKKSSYPFENYFFKGDKSARDAVWATNKPITLIADFEQLADFKFAYTRLILVFAQAMQTYTHNLKTELQKLEKL
ncbi:DUF6090 family protein [Allomuricauda sp. NBRC 101325]|uniref:DUF6090 family protein n=1 Tax=Allomuricauda sp. NBRC 101325 TaxID=1113758 RepID=UPI0024A0E3D4|nr:DUF6090 family protein [Muricauda sp. NBRC 101325]GLU44702.1 hypothetical protein Musp01_23260 [Muricauda sp. NBRC 101325]